MSAATDAVLAVLADGEWHDLDELYAAAAACVPPGQAYRTAENARQRPSHRSERGPRRHGDEATAVQSGARVTARRAVRTLVDNGRAVRDGGRVRVACRTWPS